MAKVKLGSREFDVDSKEIYASDCGVTDADCAALASRMASGEISRLKTLYLVSFIFSFFEVKSRLLFHRGACEPT